MAELAAMLVHHAEVHEQMRAEHVEFEVRPLHIQRSLVTHLLEQRVRQAASAKALRRGEQLGQPRGRFGQRHEAAARALGQALEQGLDFVLEHAGHQPFAALLAHLVQHKQRHRHGDAVARITGLVQVAGGAVHAAQAHGLGEGAGGDACGLVSHQLVAGELEQLGVGAARVLVPALKARAAAHILRHLLVVEGVDQLVIHQHVLAAGFVLQLFHLGDQLLVGGQKRQAGFPLALHQRLAQKDVARTVGVHLAKVHPAVVVDDDAVQRGALQRSDLGGLFLPVRVQHLLLEQVAANLLYPLRLNRGNAPAKQARGLHQFGRHDPAARLLVQVRAGVLVKLDAARAQVPVVLVALAAHVAQQACQHRQVNLLIAGRLRVDAPAVLGHHREQLGVDVAPLAQAADADEVLPQQCFVLAVAELVRGCNLRRCGGCRSWRCGPLPHGQDGLRRRFLERHGLLRTGRWQAGCPAPSFVDPLPQLQVAAELALFVIKLGVRLVGLLLCFQRAVAHILHAQGAGNHQHLVQRSAFAGFQNHAAHARVQRQLGQLHTHRRQLVRIVHRAQFGQELVAVGNGAARGRLDERELRHIAQVQRLHAQDDTGQGRAQDFRVGEARAAVEVRLVIQANTDTVGHAAATARALVGSSLADGLHQQLLHLATERIALDARCACVNHISDTWHRERSLGHVGGQHDAAARVAIKNTVLLGLRQAREQWQHLGVAHYRLVRQVLAQVVGRLADLAFAWQEDQYVSTRIALPQLIHPIGNGLVQTVVAAVFKRAIALLHRKGAARHHDDGRGAFGALKVFGKPVRVDGGRGDDDFQIWPARQDLADIAQQKVDVEAALVRLVDDERVVVFEQRIGLRLGQQNAVRHQLDGGITAQPVLEAHLVAHHLAQRCLQLFGNALGHAAGGNSAWLGVANELAFLTRLGIALAPAQGQRNLGQLRGLARTRLAAHDDDLVLFDGSHDLFALA